MDEVAQRIRIYAGLVAGSLSRLYLLGNPMTRLVFLRQIHFIAVRSLGPLAAIALCFGAAFVVQAIPVLGNDPRLLDLVEVVLVRHVAPLTAASIIIGRCATEISTELALMRTSGEIEMLRDLRIPPRDYLVVPRIAAVTLATMGCCFFAQVVAVVGGFSVAALILDVSLGEELRRFAEHASIGAAALEAVKSACFGMTIAAIACGTGLGVAPRMSEVPLAPSRAFLRALLAIVTIDALFLVATL